jgi:hypothetical protein
MKFLAAGKITVLARVVRVARALGVPFSRSPGWPTVGGRDKRKAKF